VANTSDKDWQHSVELAALSPNGLVIHRNGMILFANSAMESILGEPLKENQRFISVIHEDDQLKFLKQLRPLDELGKISTLDEIRLIGLNGKVKTVEVISTVVLWDGQLAIHTLIKDVSYKKIISLKRRNPYQLAWMALFIISGLRVFVDDVGLFGVPLGATLAAFVIASCLLVVIASFWTEILVGLLLERVAILSMGASLFGYNITVIFYGNLQAVVVSLLIAAASYGRLRQINQDLRIERKWY
jgi:hypothetical protein